MTHATTRSPDSLRESAHRSASDGGGGNMDDVLKRLSLAVAVLTFTIARFVKVGG
jgi:hypothetical protein